MKFIAKKCKHMRHRKQQQPNQPYTMKSGQERVVIGQVKAEKDIGVRFDEKLLLELRANAFRVIPLVILNNAMAFVYAYIQCLDGPVNRFSLTFCDLKLAVVSNKHCLLPLFH